MQELLEIMKNLSNSIEKIATNNKWNEEEIKWRGADDNNNDNNI